MPSSSAWATRGCPVGCSPRDSDRRWTYGGKGVAPGQVPAAVMIDRFRFRDAGPDAAVYGVVGDNVMHSLSPAMHNAAFAAAGIDAVYVPLRAADFADFLSFADRLGVAGASVTIPFKQDALARGKQCRRIDSSGRCGEYASPPRWRMAGK